jgi:YVTN family beta-propeller protein
MNVASLPRFDSDRLDFNTNCRRSYNKQMQSGVETQMSFVLHRSAVAMKQIVFALVSAMLALTPACAADTGAQAKLGHEYVYVQATLSKDIWVVDAETFEIAGHIPIGDFTDDVIGSPDGRFAFGNAQISSGNPLSWQINEAGKVFAISTATDKIVWSTFVEGSPHHLAISPDGNRLYVPLYDRNYILVLNAKSGQLIERWHTALGNHSLELSKDGKTLFVGSMLAQRILAYDTAAGPGGKIVKSFPAGAAVRPLVLDPDQKHIIYQIDKFHGFNVRDVATGEITKSVELPPLPASVKLPDSYPYTVDHGLGVTPDGTKLLAAASLAGYVAVYGLPDYHFLGTIEVGEDPNWIKFRSDSKIAFVSNRASNSLSVLDLTQMKEIKQVKVGRMPARFSVIRVPERNAAETSH